MIILYSWPTPNGHKVHIMLEECGFAYQLIPVDIGSGQQFEPEFLNISPNNKIPAMIDTDGPDGASITLFESGAILMYLAAKAGKLLGQTTHEKYMTLEWLMFQMGGFGPMLGQAHHFRIYAPEPIPYAIERYTSEARRLYGVLNRRLANTAFLAGDNYSIADIACYPWANSWEKQGIEWDAFPHAKRWLDTISARAAVQRGMAVMAEQRKPLTTPQAKEALFGLAQYRVR